MATTSSGTKNPDTDEKNIEKCSILTPNQTNSTEEKSPNELLQMSMEEFYRDRPILISNLPVTANEVRWFLSQGFVTGL